jgi:hypothetical protein
MSLALALQLASVGRSSRLLSLLQLPESASLFFLGLQAFSMIDSHLLNRDVVGA